MNAKQILETNINERSETLKVEASNAQPTKGFWEKVLAKLFTPSDTVKDWKRLEYGETLPSDHHLFIDPYCQWRMF